MGLVDGRLFRETAQMSAGIIDLEVFLPANVLDNATVAASLGKWRPEEIHAKIGISERRTAGQEEYTSDLAIAAAGSLLSRRPELRAKVDLLLVCTQTPDYALPTTACIVQDRLKLPRSVGAFDINLGCSGFVYALSVARSMIAAGDASLALVCCADTYCKWIGDGDPATRPIFGDGAAAILVGRLKPGRTGISRFIFGTDGEGWDKLIVRGSGAHASLNAPPATDADRHLHMNGPEIFRFTTVAVKAAIHDLLEKIQLPKEAIDWFVLHQASGFILKHLIQTCKLDPERTPIMIEKSGNTVSASIPLVLKTLLDEGRLAGGAQLVLVGFGVGYSWACCHIIWQPESEFEMSGP